VLTLKLCRSTLIRFIAVLVIISSFFTPPAYSQESEDSQIFISGFNAYQKRDYATTISRMNEVLQKYPDTPLRDMVLFWLARAYYKNGNQQDAAKFMSQFSREYPDNPLKGTVDEELLALTARYEKGEQLPVGTPPVAAPPAVAKLDTEKLRLAQETAARELQAKEQAERERIAAVKAEELRAAAESEKARLIAAKAAEERVAAEAAEKARLAAVKQEEERRAAVEKAELLKAEQAKAEQERLVQRKKEQERLAAAKLDEERQLQGKAAEARRAAESAELQKLAANKAEEERKAAAKLQTEQELKDKADRENVVKQQEEMLQRALEMAEKKRLAYEKAEQEQHAIEDAARAAKAEKKRLAALEAEKERAEAGRLAALKAEEERQAAEKAELARVERERVEKERAAAVAAESARLAEARKELERTAAAKAEAEQLAREKAELSKRAAVEAEQQKLVQLKKEQERAAAERAEKERQAVQAAETSQRKAALPVAVAIVNASPEAAPVQKTDQSDKAQASKAVLRDKAIEQYKAILVSYPSSQAAVAAAAKLRELGVAVAVPAQPAPAAAPATTENAQILRFEVAQFAGLEFNLLPQTQAYNAAQRVSIPFEIINQGNGADTFYLESGFPAEFSAGFAAAAAPAQAVNQTPVLAPGQSFKGLVYLTIPAASIDGLRISHPIKAASRTAVEATQTREVRLIAAAPLLRATVKVDRSNPLPGEKLVYRVAVLNVGSTGAQDVSFRLNYPPQLEPVDFAAAGFRQEMKAALVIDGLQLKSGESREFSLTFQLKDGSLAGQEILTRAELTNNQLKTSSAFVSTAAFVQPQHGLLVTPGSDRLIVIPGQKVAVPFVVTNTGNVREKFTVVPAAQGSQSVTIFQDLNRDGVRQGTEPVITEVGPLAAKEEVSIVMEVATPRTAADSTEEQARISFRSSGDALHAFEGVTRLIYSRPVLQMAMSGKDGRLKPGEVASFDLVITNRGSNIARIVELNSTWPEQLELVAADPTIASFTNGTLLWRFKELGAGEKRLIKVSLRVKPGTSVGTNLQVKNVLTYEDQIGNRY